MILMGDFNGSPNGSVGECITNQNYRYAVEDAWSGRSFDTDTGNDTGAGTSPNTGDNTGTGSGSIDSGARQRQEKEEKGLSRFGKLVTHKSHTSKTINCDHVFYSNPSDQTAEKLPPVPDWTNLVFRELLDGIIRKYGPEGILEAFQEFDGDNSEFISREEFASAIRQMGFGAEGQPALTSDEIYVLVDSADKNGDGEIDFKVRESLIHIHTYTHTYTHTDTHTDTYLHTYIHTYIHALIHTHKHT